MQNKTIGQKVLDKVCTHIYTFSLFFLSASNYLSNKTLLYIIKKESSTVDKLSKFQFKKNAS